MPINRLKLYLDDHKVKYVTIKHSLAYTAREIAESAHIQRRELAKTVMVNIDGKMAMAVLPATEKASLRLLKRAAGASKVTLASEDEFRDRFPECELGAMPPFGNLYGMEVFVAESLRENREIAFNAGSHVEVIKLAYQDFDRLAKPKVMSFTT
jgi:Ala-tRNA(Pro) deacylase